MDDMRNAPRTIWLDQDITPSTVDVAKQIVEFNREDAGLSVENRQPIILLFHSYGGDTDIGMMLIDTIRTSDTPVIGVNVGVCYSSACYAFLACHKRYVMPSGEFLLHRGETTIEGRYDEVIAAYKSYMKDQEVLMSIVVDRTMIPEAMINLNIDKDWYIRADEAVSLGIADQVVSSMIEFME